MFPKVIFQYRNSCSQVHFLVSRTTKTSPERLFSRATTSASVKKGIGYNDPHLTKKLAILWAYNWGQTPSGSLNSSVEYVPILCVFLPVTPDSWRLFSECVVDICPSSLTLSVASRWNAAAGSTWKANAQAAIASGSKHLLAFNEPDLDSQADMTVAQSVTAWKQYMSPLVGKGAGKARFDGGHEWRSADGDRVSSSVLCGVSSMRAGVRLCRSRLV